MTILQSEQARADLRVRLQRWQWPLVTGFFLVVTCIWFAPLMVNLNTHVLVGPSDATNGLRVYWGILELGETPWTNHHDPLNGAPEGYPHQASVEFVQPIQSAVIMLLAPALGLTAALNAFILLGFLGTAVAGYALGSRLAFGAVPSLVLGYIVAFNPWMFRRAFDGHLTFVQGWVLVLVVIAALALIERESIRAALLLGASLGLSFWVAAYFGLFGTLPVALAFVFVLVRARDLAGRLWACTLACVTAGVVALMLIPGAIAYFAEREKVNRALDNPIEQLQTFGADLSSYLLPTAKNPAFGWVTRRLLDQDPGEKIVYFGYSTMILSLAAVVLMVYRKELFSAVQRRALLYGAILVPLAILCSLPRLVHIGQFSIPTPAYVGGEFTSFYRVYVRFGYIAGIGFALLAAATLSVLLRRRSYWLAAAAIAFCVIELIPARVTTWNAFNPPPHARWLAQQPKGIVAHYPLYTDKQPAIELAGTEFYYQRFHGQPQFAVFGAGYGLTREHAIRVLARYVTDPVTPGVLAAEGVRYIVLHDDVYRQQGEAPPSLAPPNFVPVAQFPGVRVFELHAPAVDLDRTLNDNAASIGLTQGLAPGEVSPVSGFTSKSGQAGYLLQRSAAFRLTNRGQARNFELRVRLAGERPALVTLDDAQGLELARATVLPGAETLLTAHVALPMAEGMLHLSSSIEGLVVRDIQAVPLADLETRMNRN